MSNVKTKIIYSLRLHLALKQKGFMPIETMPNYLREGFVCWVYELTPQLQAELDSLLPTQEGGNRK